MYDQDRKKEKLEKEKQDLEDSKVRSEKAAAQALRDLSQAAPSFCL